MLSNALNSTTAQNQGKNTFTGICFPTTKGHRWKKEDVCRWLQTVSMQYPIPSVENFSQNPFAGWLETVARLWSYVCTRLVKKSTLFHLRNVPASPAKTKKKICVPAHFTELSRQIDSLWHTEKWEWRRQNNFSTSPGQFGCNVQGKDSQGKEKTVNVKSRIYTMYRDIVVSRRLTRTERIVTRRLLSTPTGQGAKGMGGDSNAVLRRIVIVLRVQSHLQIYNISASCNDSHQSSPPRQNQQRRKKKKKKNAGKSVCS